MAEKRLPRSLRKFIRQEKARIHRGVLNLKEQKKSVQELYSKIFKNFKIVKK